MVDKNLVLRKLAELEEYLRQVREFSSIALETYTREWKIQRIVERTLHLMIEICADSANHIISDEALRSPTSYVDIFRVLIENSLIEKSLFEKMVNMVKFRNILVHQYEKIDNSIVVGILRSHLDDFLDFKNGILQIIRTIEEKSPHPMD